MLVSSSEVVHTQGKMELLLAKIVRLGMVAQPGQFQLKISDAVAEIDDEHRELRLAVLVHAHGAEFQLVDFLIHIAD